MSRLALERLKLQTARRGDRWHWVEEADQAPGGRVPRGRKLRGEHAR